MRRILVDFARGRTHLQVGPAGQVSLDEALVMSDERCADWGALDDARTSLAKLDQRKGQIVELRSLAG